MNYVTIALDRSNSTPLYQQLTDALLAAIADGRLRPGERLLSERDLATLLGISRTTAVNAYRELEARGLLRGFVGRGTFIAAEPEADGAPFAWSGKVASGAQRTVDPAMRSLVRHSADPEVISFAAGAPALDIFPMEAFRDLMNRVLGRGAPIALGIAPTEGQPRLRRALAARVGVRPEQVLVVSGAQQGLDLIARCLIDPGDTVVIDRPGYLGAIQAFRSAGAHIVGWDFDRADPGELEDLLLRYRPKLLYTNPTMQNPTGRTLSLPERRDLLDLAARYRVPVVEDETYRDLVYGSTPPPALQTLDAHGIVIQVNTFSKTLAGGLRIGWVIATDAIVDQLAIIKGRIDVCSASLEQLVVAELIATRAYDEHLVTLRAEHTRRRDAMLAAFDRHLPAGTLTCSVPDGGVFLWCRLAPDIDSADFTREALSAGVALVNGEAFYPDSLGRAGQHHVRLCFASATPAAIDEGVRRLAEVIRSPRVQQARAAGTRVLI